MKSVDVSIDPDNIDGIEMKDLEKQYKEASSKKDQVNVKQSDLGDMVEEFEKTRQGKRGPPGDGRGNSKKQQKDFKF